MLSGMGAWPDPNVTGHHLTSLLRGKQGDLLSPSSGDRKGSGQNTPVLSYFLCE